MNREPIVVGLDIGTTKICVIVARRQGDRFEVLGMGHADSLGVQRGMISNIERTVDSIERAVKQATEASQVEIREVFVGIAGQHIRSMQHRGLLVRKDGESEISAEDIRQLTDDMHKMVVNPGDRIIHVLPQEFIVDNEPNIKDPVGMCGVRLEANFHIITGQISAAQNILRCVNKCGLHLKELILEPLASAAAVLDEEEKEAGVVLVDIGGGTTDVAIFHDHIIRHTCVIPFGGNVITDDIIEGCRVTRDQAEKLKRRFGSAIASAEMDNQIISIPGIRGRPAKEISVRNLANIINARMEEILELVDDEIERSGFKRKLVAGMVITGGGAQLKNLVQLAEYVTGLGTRIGIPTEYLAPMPGDELKHPMYSTCVGLVINGYRHYAQQPSLQPTDEAAESSGSPRKEKGNRIQNLMDRLLGGVKGILLDEVIDK
ncbi:MAG: cell division protein FtsA [Chitinophagales bacterium]|nr:cell division protein FtsA [Chitinophagales bacterium]MDW8392939.1 cell division protein FtsA [Chitinophagales bacterium]